MEDLFARLDSFLEHRQSHYKFNPRVVIGLNDGIELEFIKIWKKHRPTAPLRVFYLAYQSLTSIDFAAGWRLKMVDYTTMVIEPYKQFGDVYTPLTLLALQCTVERIKTSHAVLLFTRSFRYDSRLQLIELIAKTNRRPCFVFFIDTGTWKNQFYPERWSDKTISIFGLVCKLAPLERARFEHEVVNNILVKF